MKILIYTDPHFCEAYSLVQKMGDKYTQRLENVIKSVNWAEKTAQENGCKCVICAGDFFDKANLTQQELTALEKEIYPACFCEHYFLVGNHESEENDLHYNSAMVLRQDRADRHVVDEPTLVQFDDFEIAFLPYIKESMRKDVSEYFPEKKHKRLLISHNDLFGIQLGPVMSTVGFKPADLESICDMCVNGHLHNGKKITDKIVNLGNLTGKDLGEDAFRYSHNAMLFDTDSWTYELIENPYAFNFYNVTIDAEEDIEQLKKLKNNAVVQIKCRDILVPTVKELLPTLSNILISRTIIVRMTVDGETEFDVTDLTVDQYVKFAECCREKLEDTPILEAELAEILK